MGEALRRTLGRRLGLLLASMLVVSGLGAVAAEAASPIQVQETVPVASVFDGPLVDPCNQQPITWTGNVHLMGAITTDANGGAVFLGHVNFEDVQGTDPTGTQYTITLASNDEIVYAPSSPTLPGPNIETHTIRLNINSNNGTPNAYEDGVLHYTITPDGQVVVAFDKTGMGCTS